MTRSSFRAQRGISLRLETWQKEGFIPQKTRDGAEFLASQTPLGMTYQAFFRELLEFVVRSTSERENAKEWKLKVAETPFEFFTVAHVTRIGNFSAGTLAELLSGLEQCSDASVFHHTFQTLGTHHYLTEGFSNDFAQWVLAETNRDALAEQLAALDVRDYTSIAAIRADLCQLLREYIEQHPQFANQQALDRFYFCQSIEINLPCGVAANTLEEFHSGVKGLSHAAFYFHFISSRLRLQLRTNDFSYWLANSMGLDTLAQSINRIDIYTNTLDSARAKLLRLVERERRKHEPGSSGQSHAAV